jgi:adenylosuccinate synthase
MSVNVLVGMQWGDEGKGKLVDYLSAESDFVVRYQGGDNAGHTVINDFGVFKMHLIPCGIFHQDCACLIGTGVVLNPDSLLEEMETLINAGVSLSNLYISERAQLILPYHIKIDELIEKRGGIGTTKRGIGPAYAFKMLRKNLRAGDLRDIGAMKKTLEETADFANAQIASLGGEPIGLNSLIEKCMTWREKLGPMLVNAERMIRRNIMADKDILFEGQLGVMKDIDLGIYPYVTSSNPVAAYAAVSGGFPPKLINRVTGVAKAFSSAVGEGPFPTEMDPGEAGTLRGTGERPDDEYGARTGRARRLGWLDIPVLRYAHEVNGLTEIALTKLDKLDGMKEIKVCTGYLLDGERIDYMPDTRDLYHVEPVYETFSGWLTDTSGCKQYEMLPENARAYIEYIEKSAGVPVKYVGNGPKRTDIIKR